MEKNIEYLIKQLSKLKTEREKELGIFNWVRAGVITFEEYQEVVKNLAIHSVSQQRELFSLDDMKQAFQEGEKRLWKCYANGEDRKCYCRKDNDCNWRQCRTFEEWIKIKENCG